MADKKIPMRRCVGCRESKPKKELIRIVRCEEGFVVDESGKRNGRGAYLCKDVCCLERAEKSKGLERSFAQAIPKEVYEKLKKELTTEDA